MISKCELTFGIFPQSCYLGDKWQIGFSRATLEENTVANANDFPLDMFHCGITFAKRRLILILQEKHTSLMSATELTLANTYVHIDISVNGFAIP